MALLRTTYLLIACVLPVSAFAGTLSNPTLVENSAVAKAQAANTISLFMTTGSQTCDAEGKNCKAAYGANNSMDYASLQKNAQSITGVDAFSFMDKDGSPSTVAVQMGSMVLGCGTQGGAFKVSSGVAVKLSSCNVAADGSVNMTYRVCTAPSRNLPVEATPNAVYCSPNASDPSYFPPAGKSCLKPACDSEPEGSLNGWSAPASLSWTPNLAETATESEKTNNGLGLNFYPPLSGGVQASFTANAESMVAVKVVQSALNPDTGAAAVGLKIALRKSSTVTTAMVEAGPVAVANPAAHTSQWTNLEKMNTNPLVAQYGEKYGKRSNACLQQIQSGLSGDGTIYVCDETYDQDGVKPIAHSFQMVTEGQECGTTQQCLQKVMNTNTWTSTCEADVPLGMRNCTATTAYTTEAQRCKQTRASETCTENRKTLTETCVTAYAANGSQIEGCTGDPSKCIKELSCVPGQFYRVYIVDNSGMGNDSCNGGDVLEARWECTDTDAPRLNLTTNSTSYGTVGVVVGQGETAEAKVSYASCVASFTNNVHCVNGQCSGEVLMRLGNYKNVPVEAGCYQKWTQSVDADGNTTSTSSWVYDTQSTCENPWTHVVTACTVQRACTMQKVFQERSFGSSSRISAIATFSMANLFSVPYTLNTDTCAPYRDAH